MNWLPEVLHSAAGVDEATAATMLSMYNLVGIPHGLLVPNILARGRHPYYVILFAGGCLLTGYAGLAYDPVFAWAWIIAAGLGVMLIPVGLTLINLRSRTEDGATALSGFVQGAGYLMAAPGPLVFAQIHAVTGGWIAPFGFLMATALVGLIAGVAAVRPRFIEDG